MPDVLSDNQQATPSSEGTPRSSLGLGLAIVAVSVGVILWHEGHAAKKQRALDAVAKAAVPAPADKVLPENEGKLVYVTGLSATEEKVTDPDFGVSVNAIQLKRDVTLYQWKEVARTTNAVAGGVTNQQAVYDYVKVWEADRIDSSKFQPSSGKVNPTPVFHAELYKAKSVTVGAYRLDETLIDRFRAAEAYPVTQVGAVAPALVGGVLPYSGGLYVGRYPDYPAIGDLQVRFSVAQPGPVSVIAGQRGGTLSPMSPAPDREAVALLVPGTVEKEQMITSAQKASHTQQWVVRVIAGIFTLVGLSVAFAGGKTPTPTRPSPGA